MYSCCSVRAPSAEYNKNNIIGLWSNRYCTGHLGGTRSTRYYNILYAIYLDHPLHTLRPERDRTRVTLCCSTYLVLIYYPIPISCFQTTTLVHTVRLTGGEGISRVSMGRIHALNQCSTIVVVLFAGVRAYNTALW